MADSGRPVIDPQKTSEALGRYIRPQSFPVAVKIVGDGEEPPAGARFPGQVAGAPIALCQAIAMARRNGWTTGLREEDQSCPHAAYVLVQAAVAISGDVLTSAFSGSIACSMLIARPLKTGACQVVLSGAGDRYFALTQDHEMAFTMPSGQVETVLQGLEIGHRITGYRYPTPHVMRLQGQLPAAYSRLLQLLCQEKQETED